MSRRISEFGSLADRRRPPQPALPRHVLIRHSGGWQPGILLEWVKSDDGWLGRAVWAHGQPVAVTIGLVGSEDLRPLPSTTDALRAFAERTDG